jgi:predicted membrane channel-forming protein YqfA (hemolysin III family)
MDRPWFRTLQGRLFIALAIFVVMLGTGAGFAAAASFGVIAAVVGVILYRIETRRYR